MWQKSSNSDNIKPLETERAGNHVIVRKNIHHVEDHYEYDEWQMTSEQYAVYEAFAQELKEQSDALVELAELIVG